MEQKVSGSNPSLASRRLGNFFNLVEMVPVLESEKTIGSERRGMGSAFCMLCPNYTGPLTFTARKVTRLKETSTFITSFFFCGWGGGGVAIFKGQQHLWISFCFLRQSSCNIS